MRTLDVRRRERWRAWLAKYHASASEVWLVFHKRHTSRNSLGYEAAVEEALCFGWVYSLIKRLDDERYARKFTPRKAGSRWSTSNRRRYAKLQAAGLLTPAGLHRPPTARSGDAPRPSDSVPDDIERVLRANRAAWTCFEGLAPSYRRICIAWIEAVKQQETKRRRLAEAVRLLAAGEKLGLK